MHKELGFRARYFIPKGPIVPIQITVVRDDDAIWVVISLQLELCQVAGQGVTTGSIRTNLKYALQYLALKQHVPTCRSTVGEYQDSLTRLFFRNHQGWHGFSGRDLPNETLTRATWQEFLFPRLQMELVNVLDSFQRLCQGFLVGEMSEEA